MLSFSILEINRPRAHVMWDSARDETTPPELHIPCFPHIWPWWKSLTAPLTFTPWALWRKLTLKSRSNFCKDVGAETNFSARRPFSKLIHHPGRESRELNMDLSDLISVPFACLPPRAHLRCLQFRWSEADFTGGDTRVLSGSSTHSKWWAIC